MNIIFDNFENITKKPENFLSAQSDHTNKIKSLVKNIYDFTKDEEDKVSYRNSLPELIIENFDLEQIWQQLELQNEEFLTKSLIEVSKFVVAKDRLLFHEVNEALHSDGTETDEATNSQDESKSENLNQNNKLSDEENLSDIENDNFSNDSEKSDNDYNNEDNTDGKGRIGKQSVVDDEFFKLDEMEQFLRAEEKALSKKPDDDSGNDSDTKDDDEQIDYFESGSELDTVDDEDNKKNLREKNPRYKDFFRPENTEQPIKRNRFLEHELSEEEKIVDPKSTFELREERLKNKIKTIEDIALSDKPWQLQGEITAEKRPQNSLLEEVVEFDLISRPAPVITEKTTLQLEDIIHQRIKDRAFDSVERKEKPVETPLEYKKKLVLDQEKSKQSLAQIYEKEYLQQVEAVSGDAVDKEEPEPELHKEITKMMQNLFKQLDALSNYHFTPKPAAPEVRIISNLPAINMEEVAPVATTDASLLAPEEVKRRIKGDIIGNSERTDTDKNRQRRKKKTKQQIHVKEKKKRENLVNRMNPGLGNKYSKENAKKQLEKIIKDKNVDKMDENIGSKSVKSSAAFFKQLEEEVKSHIKVKTHTKRKKDTNGISAKKLKL